jgi:hypothetical protein
MNCENKKPKKKKNLNECVVLSRVSIEQQILEFATQRERLFGRE